MGRKHRIVAESWRPKVGERVRLVGRDEDGNEIAAEAVVLRVHHDRGTVSLGRAERRVVGEAAGTDLRPR